MTKTILIVEDNEASLSLLRDFLEEEGYRVVATGEGVEAIALALENGPAQAVRMIASTMPRKLE